MKIATTVKNVAQIAKIVSGSLRPFSRKSWPASQHATNVPTSVASTAT